MLNIKIVLVKENFWWRLSFYLESRHYTINYSFSEYN